MPPVRIHLDVVGKKFETGFHPDPNRREDMRPKRITRIQDETIGRCGMGLPMLTTPHAAVLMMFCLRLQDLVVTGLWIE